MSEPNYITFPDINSALKIVKYLKEKSIYSCHFFMNNEKSVSLDIKNDGCLFYG